MKLYHLILKTGLYRTFLDQFLTLVTDFEVAIHVDVIFPIARLFFWSCGLKEAPLGLFVVVEVQALTVAITVGFAFGHVIVRADLLLVHLGAVFARYMQVFVGIDAILAIRTICSQRLKRGFDLYLDKIYLRLSADIL